MLPKQTRRRALFLVVLVGLMFMGIGYRFWYLQIRRAAYYEAQAKQDYLRKLPIPAPRGNMVSADGVTVATSKPSWTLYYLSRGGPMPKAEEDRIATLLHVSAASIDQTIRTALKTLPSYDPISIDSGLTPAEMTAIEEHLSTLPNLRIQPVPVRSYPYNSTMGNIIGFVSPINATQYQALKSKGYSMTAILGSAGLEKAYQSYLHGQRGGEYAEVNRQGQLVRLFGQAVPTPGDTLHLTINWRLEQTAQKALQTVIDTLHQSSNPTAHSPGAESGGVIALDPNNGDVLAIASLPSYNPNNLIPSNQAERSKYYTQLLKDPSKPMFIRPIQGRYAPGSVFKPITAVAALASHTVTAATRIFDPGYFPKLPALKNWYPSGFGSLDIIQAIGLSDDVFFYTLGYDMGIQVMDKWFDRFLLNQPTHIDLPEEVSSVVPTPSLYPPWTWGQNLNVAIGQGQSEYTLIALARAEAAIANGGTLYRPHLVASITTPGGKLVKKFGPTVQGRLNVPASVLQTVQKGMELSAQSSNIANTGYSGTGYGALRGFPLPLASKTGTAQVNGKPNNAFFITYGPMPHPKILIIVYVKEGLWGANSGFVARAIYDQYFKVADPKAKAVFDSVFGPQFNWPFGYQTKTTP